MQYVVDNEQKRTFSAILLIGMYLISIILSIVSLIAMFKLFNIELSQYGINLSDNIIKYICIGSLSLSLIITLIFLIKPSILSKKKQIRNKNTTKKYKEDINNTKAKIASYDDKIQKSKTDLEGYKTKLSSITNKLDKFKQSAKVVTNSIKEAQSDKNPLQDIKNFKKLSKIEKKIPKLEQKYEKYSKNIIKETKNLSKISKNKEENLKSQINALQLRPSDYINFGTSYRIVWDTYQAFFFILLKIILTTGAFTGICAAIYNFVEFEIEIPEFAIYIYSSLYLYVLPGLLGILLISFGLSLIISYIKWERIKIENSNYFENPPVTGSEIFSNLKENAKLEIKNNKAIVITFCAFLPLCLLTYFIGNHFELENSYVNFIGYLGILITASLVVITIYAVGLSMYYFICMRTDVKEALQMAWNSYRFIFFTMIILTFMAHSFNYSFEHYISFEGQQFELLELIFIIVVDLDILVLSLFTLSTIVKYNAIKHQRRQQESQSKKVNSKENDKGKGKNQSTHRIIIGAVQKSDNYQNDEDFIRVKKKRDNLFKFLGGNKIISYFPFLVLLGAFSAGLFCQINFQYILPQNINGFYIIPPVLIVLISILGILFKIESFYSIGYSAVYVYFLFALIDIFSRNNAYILYNLSVIILGLIIIIKYKKISPIFVFLGVLFNFFILVFSLDMLPENSEILYFYTYTEFELNFEFTLVPIILAGMIFPLLFSLFSKSNEQNRNMTKFLKKKTINNCRENSFKYKNIKFKEKIIEKFGDNFVSRNFEIVLFFGFSLFIGAIKCIITKTALDFLDISIWIFSAVIILTIFENTFLSNFVFSMLPPMLFECCFMLSNLKLNDGSEINFLTLLKIAYYIFTILIGVFIIFKRKDIRLKYILIFGFILRLLNFEFSTFIANPILESEFYLIFCMIDLIVLIFLIQLIKFISYLKEIKEFKDHSHSKNEKFNQNLNSSLKNNLQKRKNIQSIKKTIYKLLLLILILGIISVMTYAISGDIDTEEDIMVIESIFITTFIVSIAVPFIGFLIQLHMNSKMKYKKNRPKNKEISMKRRI